MTGRESKQPKELVETMKTEVKYKILAKVAGVIDNDLALESLRKHLFGEEVAPMRKTDAYLLLHFASTMVGSGDFIEELESLLLPRPSYFIECDGYFITWNIPSYLVRDVCADIASSIKSLRNNFSDSNSQVPLKLLSKIIRHNTSKLLASDSIILPLENDVPIGHWKWKGEQC